MPPPRNDHVDVRMMRHGRPPGVEHGGEADPCAEMLGIGRDGEHGLRRGLEQQVVHSRLVVEGDVGELGRDGEDHMEVADRQQVGRAGGQPHARRRTLTPGLRQLL